MDEITHEVRLSNWKEIISQCENRKEGVSAKQWLLDNHIPRDRYYYWLRRVRKEVFTSAEKAALPQLKPKADPVTFAEIPVSNSPSSSGSDSFVPDAVIRMGHTTIALSNTASDALISKIMEALNAC